jgi:hypothetical protein
LTIKHFSICLFFFFASFFQLQLPVFSFSTSCRRKIRLRNVGQEDTKVKYTRRTFLRRYREAPVEIRHDGTQICHPARMSDCCRGGMQLIYDRFIEPGAEVIIGPGDHMVDILNGSANEDCLAEVVWCHRCDKEIPNRFIIGVRFVRPSSH